MSRRQFWRWLLLGDEDWPWVSRLTPHRHWAMMSPLACSITGTNPGTALLKVRDGRLGHQRRRSAVLRASAQTQS